MGTVKLTYALLLVSLLSLPARAGDPEVINVGLQKAFVPIGFDDNDRVQLMVSGVLNDTCRKIGPYEVVTDEATKTVTIKQTAYVYQGICLDVIVPFAHVVDLGLLKEGLYQVNDATSGKAIGTLPVAISKGIAQDDVLYAPVRDASIIEEDGCEYLYLTGTFTSRCMRLKEKADGTGKDVRISYYQDVIVVQPVAEMIEPERGGCGQQKTRYQFRTPLKSGLTGATLLHVRSIEGTAINKLVEFP